MGQSLRGRARNADAAGAKVERGFRNFARDDGPVLFLGESHGGPLPFRIIAPLILTTSQHFVKSIVQQGLHF